MNTNTKTFNRDLKKFPLGTYNAQFIKLIPTSNGEYRLKFLIWYPEGKSGKGDTESYATFNKYSKAYIQKNFFDGKTEEETRNSQWEIKLAKNPHNDLRTISSFKRNQWTYTQAWIEHHEDYQGCKNTDAQLSPEKAEYLAKRRLNDPKFARTEELRNLQARAIRGEIMEPLMSKVFGIDHEGLINHLKETGKKHKGIKWEKRNTYHVDHIKPLASFNVLDPVEAKKAIHYSNLQLLPPEKNLEKYANTATPSLSYIEQVLG